MVDRVVNRHLASAIVSEKTKKKLDSNYDKLTKSKKIDPVKDKNGKVVPPKKLSGEEKASAIGKSSIPTHEKNSLLRETVKDAKNLAGT